MYLLTQTANALFSLFFFPPQNTPAHGYILNLYLLIFFFHFCLCQQCCISHSRHFSVSNLSAEVLKQKPTKCVCRLSISCHQSISAWRVENTGCSLLPQKRSSNAHHHVNIALVQNLFKCSIVYKHCLLMMPLQFSRKWRWSSIPVRYFLGFFVGFFIGGGEFARDFWEVLTGK